MMPVNAPAKAAPTRAADPRLMRSNVKPVSHSSGIATTSPMVLELNCCKT